MNKKLLSGVLIGAMLVTSAGSFVSCQKDYDDDIDSLEQRMQSVESTVSSLNSQISAGKWITSLSSVTGGFSVTFSDGSSYTITNGKDGADGKDGAAGEKGADGKDGSTVTVNEDGYWVIDGVVTEYVASKSAETSAKSPYVGEDGYWYFYNEDGEAEKSDYKAVGAAYAAYNSTTGVWTLYIPDGSGKLQTIELPTAASKISGIAFTNASANGALAIYKAKFTRPDRWGGSKTLPATGDAIYGSSDTLEIQVSPSDVAKDIKAYTLVNSKNTTLGLALTASAYDGLITATGTRAASNGLYYLTVAPQVVASADTSAVKKAIEANNNGAAAGYAVEADGVFRSAYKVALSTGSVPSLTKVTVNNASPITIAATASTATGEATVDVNATNKVTFDDAAAVYDSYLYVTPTVAQTYGITIDGNTFKVGQNPDTQTRNVSFPLTVYTLGIAGDVKTITITVKLSSTISGGNVLAAQTVDVSASNPGFGFSISDLGLNAQQLLTWKNNVALGSETVEVYKTYSDGQLSDLVSGVAAKHTYASNGDVTSSTLFAYDIYTANNITTTSVENASEVYFDVINDNMVTPALKLDTPYYVKVTFNDKTSTSSNIVPLNSVVVPVTFTAPSVADQFAVIPSYTDNAGVINAYFYNTTGTDTEKKTVALKRYFSKSLDDVAITLDSRTRIVANQYTAANLAEIGNDDSFDDATITFKSNTTPSNSQYELGYGVALTVNVQSPDYKEWLYVDNADKATSFQIRLMSPINEGSIRPASGNTVTISANDVVNGAQITDSMVKGYDYNGNAYSVVPDTYVRSASATSHSADQWANPQIKDVQVDVDELGLLSSATVEPAAQDAEGNTVKGYIKVTANALTKPATVELPVYVTDVWGYVLADTVNVTIQTN